MKKDNISVEGHYGTWYVIDELIYHGKKVYLLEHETYGDEAASLIVDEDLNIILDDVYNGFEDLDDLEGEELVIINRNAEKMSPEKRKKLLDMARIMFKEED